jgi:hypothetical protein
MDHSFFKKKKKKKKKTSKRYIKPTDIQMEATLLKITETSKRRIWSDAISGQPPPPPPTSFPSFFSIFS